MSELMCLCSMKGDQVSSGHPIAYFGHCKMHSFGFNAMGWKGIEHPIHPKCVFWHPILKSWLSPDVPCNVYWK